MVIIPGAGGVFGVLPGHVPTISELKPGVLEVTIAPNEVVKYFVSSGFAFAHSVSLSLQPNKPDFMQLQSEGTISYGRFHFRSMSQEAQNES